MKRRANNLIRSAITVGAATLLVACGVLFTGGEAEAQGHVLSIGRTSVIQAKLGSTLSIDVPVEIQSGFHVNSNTPSDEYLIPLRLRWDEKNVLTASLISFPKPVMESYSFSPTPLSVFTEQFSITTEFKVPADAALGPNAINGDLRYQACNDRECLAPKTLNFALQIDVIR